MSKLTEKDIAKAAKGRRAKAIACSIQHWEEMRDAKTEDLFSDIMLEPFCDNCALCRKYFEDNEEAYCIKCPLYKAGYDCNADDSVWSKAYRMYDDGWIDINMDHKVPGSNFRRKWRAICNKMIEILKSL
jgi:hypothetical protein